MRLSRIMIAWVVGVLPGVAAAVDVGMIDFSTPAARQRAVEALREESRRSREEAWKVAQQQGWPTGGQVGNRKFALIGIENGWPVYVTTDNANAAITTAANEIRQTPPYDLSGLGFTVGIWDVGSVRVSHQEFAGRPMVRVRDGAGVEDHATHVAGTIGATGIDPAAMGMAPEVGIDSYDWDEDVAEMAERAASYAGEPGKICVSNHSYGHVSGWYGGFYWLGRWPAQEDEKFGQYDSSAVTWDAVCYAAPYYLPFKSAGNDRNDPPPADGMPYLYFSYAYYPYYPVAAGVVFGMYDSAVGPLGDGAPLGGYDTIPTTGNAKNIMTVGAVTAAVFGGVRDVTSATISDFSGWGPTDDGRIKPDIVADGVDVYSCVATDDAAYDIYSGTSMSSPNAVGSAILLVEWYSQLSGGSAMRASTLKGLIIHTADDLGNPGPPGSPGPDYVFGWGLMNAKAAADQIANHFASPAGHCIVEGLLDGSNAENTYTFEWDEMSSIRATLCWTDPPGGAVSSLNNPMPRLMNDLDLRVIGPDGSTTFLPYVLDQTNPSAAATTGDNTADNVEQVYVEVPPEPGTYTVQVSHKRRLIRGQQHYSLILSGQVLPAPSGETPPPEDSGGGTEGSDDNSPPQDPGDQEGGDGEETGDASEGNPAPPPSLDDGQSPAADAFEQEPESSAPQTDSDPDPPGSVMEAEAAAANTASLPPPAAPAPQDSMSSTGDDPGDGGDAGGDEPASAPRRSEPLDESPVSEGGCGPGWAPLEAAGLANWMLAAAGLLAVRRRYRCPG